MGKGYKGSGGQYHEGYGTRYASKSAVTDNYKFIFDTLHGLNYLSENETDELIERMHKLKRAGKHGLAGKLRNKAIEGNLRLNFMFAIGYSIKYGKELSDLFNAGGIGMMRALECYDHKKGRFRNYIPLWIMEEMSKLVTFDNIVRESNSQIERYRKIKKAQKEIGSAEPIKMINEIEKSTGYSFKDIIQIIDTHNRWKHIDLLVEAHHHKGDANADAPTKRIFKEEQKSFLQEAMKKYLSAIEQNVLTGHYGLGENNGKMTLRQLGKRFHISYEMIRQIEIKAKNKLKWSRYGKALEDFIT